jgi:hypothetical protein
VESWRTLSRLHFSVPKLVRTRAKLVGGGALSIFVLALLLSDSKSQQTKEKLVSKNIMKHRKTYCDYQESGAFPQYVQTGDQPSDLKTPTTKCSLALIK